MGAQRATSLQGNIVVTVKEPVTTIARVSLWKQDAPLNIDGSIMEGVRSNLDSIPVIDRVKTSY